MIKGERDLVGCWIAGLVIGAGIGIGLSEARVVLDARAERAAIYGVELDHSKPWAASACEEIATEIAIGRIVRQAQGRKSLFIAQVQSRHNPEVRENQEAVREIADAWDRADDGPSFYASCLRRLKTQGM
jgi:hypothetical protein